MSRRCLVVTGTQADADSYNRRLITRSNFSEDKRKLAHVDGIIGINEDSNDRQQGVTRLNWVVLRDGSNDPYRCLYVAGCREIGNPCILSRWKPNLKGKRK